MDTLTYVLVLAAGLAVVFLACSAPEKFFRVLGILAGNTCMGLALLLAVNTVAGGTVHLPLNAVTVGVSGVLGAPGVAAITALAVI